DDELEISASARRRKENDSFPSGRLVVKVFEVLDDNVARAIEKRGFVILRGFYLNDFDFDVVVAARHLPNAENHRRAVVVAIGEPYASHLNTGSRRRMRPDRRA